MKAQEVAAPKSGADAKVERELARLDEIIYGMAKRRGYGGLARLGMQRAPKGVVPRDIVDKLWLDARDALLSAERQRRQLRDSLRELLRVVNVMEGNCVPDSEYQAAVAEAEALLEGGTK